jgi:hypothetical protein
VEAIRPPRCRNGDALEWLAAGRLVCDTLEVVGKFDRPLATPTRRCGQDVPDQPRHVSEQAAVSRDASLPRGLGSVGR